MELTVAAETWGTWQVVVAGAGPAGLATAIACASAGLSVLLLAPPRFVPAEAGRQPLETLHPMAVRLLGRLGAAAAIEASSVGRLYTLYRNGEPVAPDASGEPAVHVDRRRFDDWLAAHARQRGAVFSSAGLTGLDVDERRVHARLSDGSVANGRWLVDATGKARTGCRLAGLQWRKLGRALIARSGVVPAAGGVECERNRFDSFGWGWIWMTAAEGGFRTWTALHSPARETPGDIERLMRQSIEGSLRAERASWVHSYPVGVERLLAVGDAAGTIDPGSGQGILNALSSGLKAADTILRSVAGEGLPALNVVAYHRWFVDHLSLQARTLEGHYRELGIGLVG